MNKWQQQVYDMLRAAGRNNLPCTVPADVVHIPVNMMLEADRMRWISVKDGLPPEGKFVNVAGINKWTGEIELIPFVAWLLDGEWMCEDAEQQLVNQHGCTVTYWSEIPEPPKTDGGKEDDV